ncbi:protein phosphatase 1 regulatory subunit 36 isoform X2 [Xiphias gladius]|uniref:protein phosphatase 1 regulatory subunit 36 isoform X2 n=1 Tax=Xiphias gladius TaxID=8245 RepID=UPI001A999484|nr:protein phosphatase 1 regulatory subunit 36 isoform X2 [Xiphias gladius]
MPKYPEDVRSVSVPPPGRWAWSDESQTVELVSSGQAEEGVLSERRQTHDDFKDLQRRAEWLADVHTSNPRGRQSIRKSLSPARLTAYRSSVMKRRGDRVSIDDVKHVAVSLLQEHYSLPIPFCFLAILKSKELDEVLAALLLYLSYFFEHKSLENKPKPVSGVDIIAEHQMTVETLAKKEIAQKKLAVSYFTLELEQHQQTAYQKVHMSNSTEWLLHACMYSFYCFVAWVTFGRKDLRDIQEEVGRLLYSDTFQTAVRSGTDGDSGTTSTTLGSSAKTGEADPRGMGCNGTFKHRTSDRRPALSSVVDQRSPLMVSLLPSPKEQSPHLFLSSRARRQSLLQIEHCDTKALTEELNQQLASVSFGILGKPLRQFSLITLIPYGEQKNNRDEDEDHEPDSDVNNNSEDNLGIHVRGSMSSFEGPKSTGPARYGSTTHINTRNAAATTEAVTANTE